ncbi:glycosyltransferase family 4 protein [Streptomyces benahoarensis]|uniref:Glycosyltransferase family 4 protein n=1 Tax=Streptomyces benahoarensis TaxID=2595054 RepID=A0A553ZQ69_9ACTN|nr:glycosyltransferase family 4 protein [Streptomyces benahoarensis]TSB31388.1 glycosyltransferase family 4 protein [Streptomyces benahoarensis]TSB43592.1 glycosyltransferase family 4 protein [Streptomyces benahoarensis]
MTRTPPPPHGQAPLRTVQVLGHGATAGAAHVRSLTAGLIARGVQVTVCAPPPAEETHGFTAAGARFVPVAARPDPVALAALRGAFRDADVVHAHGVRAGLSAMPVLRTVRGPRGGRLPLVVTWHTAARATGALVRLRERQLARAAAVVLGVCAGLVDRARERGARDARLAPVAPPGPRTGGDGGEADRTRHKVRAELGVVDRPLVLAAGPLEERQEYDLLLDAAHAWAAREPRPLLVVVGEGSRRAALQRRIDTEELPVLLAGHRADLPELLATADVVAVPGRWEARPPLAQQALAAGAPLVAAATGELCELLGPAAELTRPGDAVSLARAVLGLLADPARRTALATAGPLQAADWPTEDATVAQVLSVYDEVARPGCSRAPA